MAKFTMQCNKTQWLGGLAALSLAALLASCSPGSVIDRLPNEMGGLPADAPKRSAAPPPYPAVHDVPGPRSGTSSTLSDADQLRLEKELAAARSRQEALQDPTIKSRGDAATAAGANAMENAKAAAKKKPTPPNAQ